MSLISDALKRTQANTTPPPRPPRPSIAAAPVVRGVVPHRAPEKSNNVLILVLLGVIVVVGVGALGLWQLYSMFAANAKAVAQVSTMEATPSAPIPKATPKPPEPVAPSPAIPDQVKEVMRAAQADAPKVERVAPPPTPTPAPPPPPKELPKLVLQGVTIHGGLREALINGQTVAVGDEVDGAKVVAIEQNKVKLKFDGRDVTLTFSR